MASFHILFANDDVITQWTTSELLNSAGFDVTSACRGTQVSDLLNDAPEFDLLLADIELPDSAPEFNLGALWQRTCPGRSAIFTGPGHAAYSYPLQLHPLRPHEVFLATPYRPRLLIRTVMRAIRDAALGIHVPNNPRRVHHVH